MPRSRRNGAPLVSRVHLRRRVDAKTLSDFIKFARNKAPEKVTH